MIDQKTAQHLCLELGIHNHVLVHSEWLYGAVRHIVRNVDVESFLSDDVDDSLWIPQRHDGPAMAAVLQKIIDTAYPTESL